MKFCIVPTSTHSFLHCQSKPINYNANPTEKKRQVNSEYKKLRHEHAICAMREVIAGIVTGQGKIDLKVAR